LGERPRRILDHKNNELSLAKLRNSRRAEIFPGPDDRMMRRINTVAMRGGELHGRGAYHLSIAPIRIN
jgi:hypothetical protein